jgi:hypothetical protein
MKNENPAHGTRGGVSGTQLVMDFTSLEVGTALGNRNREVDRCV